MIPSTLPLLLSFYGAFLLLCGITAVIFIGKKAKTALISGGTSALLSFLVAYLYMKQVETANWAGPLLSLSLFFVFSWRSTLTLFKIFDLIQEGEKSELRGKGIAFLIISLMAVVSLFVFMGQWILLTLE